MMKTSILSIIISSIVLCSCSTHQTLYDRLDSKTKNSQNEIYMVSNDALRRGSYFIKHNNKIRFISEPPPDAVIAVTREFANKIDYNKLNNDLKVKITESLSTLGERTVAVNILRDALYKLTEISLNNDGQTIDNQTYQLFDRILCVAENISNADIKRSETAKEIAETAKINTEIKLQEIKKELGAKENYQIAIRFLLDQDIENSLNYFNKLYKDYPDYFNIDEIRKELLKLSKNGMTKDKWTSLYNYIITQKLIYRIDSALIYTP